MSRVDQGLLKTPRPRDINKPASDSSPDGHIGAILIMATADMNTTSTENNTWMAPPEDDEHDEMVLYDTIKSFNMIKTMPESNFVWNPGFEDGLTDECSTYTPATPSCRSGPTYDLRWCPTQDYNYEASQGNSEWPAESPCRGSVPECSSEDLNRGPVSPVTRLFQQLAGADNTSPHQVTSQGTFLPKSNELDKKASVLVRHAIRRYLASSGCDTDARRPQRHTPVIVTVYEAMKTFANNVNKSFKRTKKRRSSAGSMTDTDALYDPLAEGQIKLRSSGAVKRLLRFTHEHRHQKSTSFIKRKEPSGFRYKDEPEVALATVGRGDLELMQFIVCHGILRPELRDEIYSQVCYELRLLTSPSTRQRAWLLLAMVISSFPPDDQASPYIRKLIHWISADFNETVCQKLLQLFDLRCVTQSRCQPPGLREYEAMKQWSNLKLPLWTPDGHVGMLMLTAVTTTADVCNLVAYRCHLESNIGFALCLADQEKLMSMGYGKDQVLDYISEQEELLAVQGGHQGPADCHLYFRCEMFCPWMDAAQQPLLATMICKQMKLEMATRTDLELTVEDAGKLAACLYLIHNNFKVDLGSLASTVHSFLPLSSVTSCSREQWVRRVTDELGELRSGAMADGDRTRVLQEAIAIMMNRWYLSMSCQYRGRLVHTGDQRRDERVLILINNQGVYMQPRDDPQHCTHSIEFYKIVEVYPYGTAGRRATSRLGLRTVTGVEYEIRSPNAQDVMAIVGTFVEGLRQRSRFAMALGNSKRCAVAGKQGDLLVLLDSPEERDQRSYDVMALNVRNGQQGPVTFSDIYLLPTLTKPPEKFIASFAHMPQTCLASIPCWTPTPSRKSSCLDLTDRKLDGPWVSNV